MAKVFRDGFGRQIIFGSGAPKRRGFTASVSYLDDPIIAAQRNALVAAHDIGGTSEASFTGFTDTTGWTQVTVTTADELRGAITSTGLNEKKVITCQWNGVSTPAADLMNVNYQTDLNAGGFANPAVDIGYNRPEWSVLITAADGFSPSVGLATTQNQPGTALQFRGPNYLEIRGMTFEAGLFLTNNPGFNPLIGVTAFKNCRFKAGLNGYARTCHAENCKFGPESGASTSGSYSVRAQWARLWSSEFHRSSKAADLIRQFGYDRGYMNDWEVHTWVAGTIVYNSDEVTGAESPNHSDIFQYTTGADIHAAHQILIEFNVWVNNVTDSQGMFGDDWSNTKTVQSDILVHNNIIVINAYWAVTLYDESGNGTMRAYRNLTCRGSVPGRWPPASPTDSNPFFLVINQYGSGLFNSGTGVIEVRENYYNYLNTNGAGNPVAVEGNIGVNAGIGAVVGTRMEDLFTGNGTWARDGNNYQVYTAPDYGITDAAAARAAIIAFYMPVGGWRSQGCGPVDPTTWPTNFDQVLT